MTERDPIERRLLLARSATWAPEAAKARVRANLAGGGALSAASVVRAGRDAGVTKLTTALLVGASFVAGYWLGFQRSAEPAATGLPATALPAAATADHATLASPDGESVRGAGSARQGLPADAVDAADAADATSLAAPRHDSDASRTTAPRRASGSRARSNHLDRATPGRALLARAPAASSDPAADELALLSRAERAIRAGEPALALSFLDELEARFPSSSLLEERVAARLLANCALANPGSRRRAELFLSDRAASVYTDRVRRSCGLEAPLTTAPSPISGAADGSSRSGH